MFVSGYNQGFPPIFEFYGAVNFLLHGQGLIRLKYNYLCTQFHW